MFSRQYRPIFSTLTRRTRIISGDNVGQVTSINSAAEKSDVEARSLGVNKLFTPGPLGVSLKTRQAMLQDVGSRDIAFIETVKNIRKKLLDIADIDQDKFSVVPMQGSGTFAVESVFTTTLPKNGKVLILENGVYGRRMAQIVDVLGAEYKLLSFPENEKVDVTTVEEYLREELDFNLVAIVHCETSTGTINPIEKVGKLINHYLPNCMYFVDAMSSFGAIPINVKSSKIDFMVSSANKCLEGVPGFAYVIANKKSLLNCKGQSRSLSLDLVAQLESLDKNGQFRFTPPTHTMLAFNQALTELKEEGGISARAKRYQKNRNILKNGMKKMGFRELLDKSHEGFIITSFYYPTHPSFNFNQFYNKLLIKGQVIYPGKVTNVDCFRIGNIGHLFPADMEYLLECIEEVCLEMGMLLPLEEEDK